MVVCFLCKNNYDSFGAFKAHLTLFHDASEYRTLVCSEENCNRNFQLFNSFRRHLLTHTNKAHISSSPADKDAESHTRDSEQVTATFNENLVSDVEPTLELRPEVSPVNTLQSVFETSVSTLIASLYANHNLPRNVVDIFFEGLRDCVSDSLLIAITNTLENLARNGEIPSSCVETVIKSITPLLKSPWEKFGSEYKRLQHFEKTNTFIRPRQVVIGQRLETVKENNVSRLIPITCEQSFISLRTVLKNFFSLKGILVETLNFIKSLQNNSLKSNSAIENFIQGSYWQSVMQRHKNKIVMPLFLYFDDYETGNVLGSRAGQHKLGAVYISLPCLPAYRSSSLKNIFLFLLFHSADRVTFGNKVIFRCVIDELNYLADAGIEFAVPGFTGTVYFELGLILGDNLGIHSICGFIESFSANFPCRICKTRKDVMKNQCVEDTSLLRNDINYQSDLLVGNPSETGIKEKCIWLELNNFSLFDQIAVDWMHDVLEGVAKYIMCLVIKKLTREYDTFSVDLLNQRLESFSYGPDNRNKPCSLSSEHINNGNIKLSSSEMLTFIRYLSLLVGEFVPEGNEFWKLYIQLRIIIDIMSSTAFAKGTEELLQTHITNLNTLYLSLSNDTLKPKFHHLLHYHTGLKKFGPLIHFWSMRFEAKHRLSKIAARASMNRRNITLSLAIKEQLKLNEIFLSGQLDDVIKTGPESECNYLELQFVVSNLQLSSLQKLTKTSWATVASTYYSKDSILVYSTSPEDLVTFFKLTDIFILNSKFDVILKGYLMKTLCFNEHFYAYEVFEPEEIRFAVKLQSQLESPIPCHISIVCNKKYVTLRSPI
ncbi:uncharacterized protein LOC111352853 isoform X1 [Spodoptera litura]|uniref:Uncharacterized protein LOC111352853 isoform X1 n=1 Tax=Spodoptera litura TaxID=69820 RepID=A0A9J7IS45_SPOLT|nr:uncharacterized protein LOC111352853 isoform X1 [Spodoptera litura]XP_022821295.1 uncharacterized protein LOC111352853 isoform X1 [Spodoptera litura]XP_022821304.1 uncharacterized protein LOC111352853 isoform X1 [Spodoptera litura]